jgi:hypothetical protein
MKQTIVNRSKRGSRRMEPQRLSHDLDRLHTALSRARQAHLAKDLGLSQVVWKKVVR